MSGSKIIDVCITHTCIRVKGRRPKIYTSYMHVSGSCINVCIMHHTYMHHGHVYQDEEYMHHTYIHKGQGSYIQYMHQDQESKIIDTCKQACIIHPTPRIALFVRSLVRNKISAAYMAHGLSARRARRTKSRGPKGLQLEVGARRAPRLLVVYILI